MARDRWNAACERNGLPRAQTFDKPRRRAVEARLADLGGLKGWDAMLGKIDGASAWFRTEFRPGLDWILKPANLTKLMEGNYDDKPAGAAPFGNGKVDGRSNRPVSATRGHGAFYDALARAARST